MSSILAKISLLDVIFLQLRFFFLQFRWIWKVKQFRLSLIFGACCVMGNFNLFYSVITHASVDGCPFSV